MIIRIVMTGFLCLLCVVSVVKVSAAGLLNIDLMEYVGF